MNLEKTKENVANSRRCAESIMDGGDNYDGADGAREVLDLCDTIDSLIVALESK